MVIDAHQHFWKFDPVRDAWITDNMKVIKRDFFPEDLEPVLRANHIDGCVAVQADQSVNETQFLLSCAEEHPFIKGVVGWVDLLSPNVEERLSVLSKNKMLKGIRHIVQAEANDFMLRKDFQNGISKLSQFGLTYDILVFQQQLPAAVQLAQKFPDQAFVLDHIAKPAISEGLSKDWERLIKELSKYYNVYCKLSGLVTETNNFVWKEEEFKPFLDVVCEAFGYDRLMFGSDWPVCLLSCEYSKVMHIIKNYIPEEHQPKVFGENATRFYNLDVQLEKVPLN